MPRSQIYDLAAVMRDGAIYSIDDMVETESPYDFLDSVRRGILRNCTWMNVVDKDGIELLIRIDDILRVALTPIKEGVVELCPSNT